MSEALAGSERPVDYYLAETLDGLYAPYAMRTPADEGQFPFVFLAYGNGGGGLTWLRERVHRYRPITDRLLGAGYACAWARYRTEVELGYLRGGPLAIQTRQGMELMSRSPLEFEDELAILRDVAQHPLIDPDRLCHVGVSHAGEMLFKLLAQYPGVLRAGVAVEPANHEFLNLALEDDAPVQTAGMRDIENLQLRDSGGVRARMRDVAAIDRLLARVDIPVMVVGREQDELQGIFRLSYELLAQHRADAEWRSWAHEVHGYVFPVVGETGEPLVDEVQAQALDAIVDFLNRHASRRG
ncbi:MAG: hypothetical protein M3130_00995 [Actinomycetota bacterium]|nr:hypothetical protein [Actinomycetota bacterium]